MSLGCYKVLAALCTLCPSPSRETPREVKLGAQDISCDVPINLNLGEGMGRSIGIPSMPLYLVLCTIKFCFSKNKKGAEPVPMYAGAFSIVLVPLGHWK